MESQEPKLTTEVHVEKPDDSKGKLRCNYCKRHRFLTVAVIVGLLLVVAGGVAAIAVYTTRSTTTTPSTSTATAASYQPAPDERTIARLVASKVAGAKVMMFSITTCPYCKRAKKVFQKYLDDGSLSKEDYDVMELNHRKDRVLIMKELLKRTGAATVPRIFINGTFVGGSDTIVAMDKSGQLRRLLVS